MVAITPVTDATSSNFSALQFGMKVAGYTTGTPDIRWTAEQFAQFPDAIRIDQDARASDPTADILDVEAGAATIAECAPWVKAARQNWLSAKRPGQREPGIYCSKSMVTAVANALVAGGVDRCPLWVASWGIGTSGATKLLLDSGGPYPIVGVQFQNFARFDESLFLDSWLSNVSGKKAAVQAPPGQWIDPKLWTWKDVAIVGLGLDGNLHSFVYDDAKDTWTKVA